MTISRSQRVAAPILIGVVLLLAGCGGGGGGDDAVSGNPPASTDPVRVSSLTPFTAGCNGTPASGTLFSNTEVEPFVAVNPAATSNLVGVWQQDRWSSGGAQGLVTGVSFDAGLTWSTASAAFSRCTGGRTDNGGDYERATDPWVTFAPDGTVYQSAAAFSGTNFTAGAVNAVLVSRSADGGRSWSNPVALIRDGSDFFNDKEAITADPTDARYVYVVWDRISPSAGGPTWFSRTIDGGRTWEAARQIYDPGPGSQTINNQIVVLPDSTLVNFFTRIIGADSGTPDTSLVVMRSSDKGASWSAPVVIAAVQALGTRDPETRVPIRDGANLGSIAAGRDGTLAVVWQDSRFSGGTHDGIAFSRSIDGGSTWSLPVRVNSVAAVQAFVPTVHVRGDGRIGVTYYDLRNNTSDPGTLPTDLWLTSSADGVNWLEAHVSGPFDLAIAPNARGLFIGDYQALTSIGGDFVPFFAQTNTGNASNRTDVFVARLSGAAPVSATAATAREAQGPRTRPATLRAEAATSLAPTPELSRRLAESALLTIERRTRR